MPFISDKQLATLQGYVDRSKAYAERERRRAREKAGEAAMLLTGTASVGVIGFARGKFEDQTTGAWNIPGTPIDIEAALGLVGCGMAYFDMGGRYNDLLGASSFAVLMHYTGQVMRKWGKTGQFGLIAGGGSIHSRMPSNVGMDPTLIGANWDPVSYNPTQISSPYSDPVAMALDQSGV